MHIHGQLIERYKLEPHPEGGWYRQTYKCDEQIAAVALPERFGGARPFSTAIYFLLEQGNFSAFHRIKSDECWHFYAGDPLEVLVLFADGTLHTTLLGQDIDSGQLFQYIVPANCWFASRPASGSIYSFVGCTVAPGFDFADFELASADELIQQFPQHEKLIRELARETV
jgi:predicted cupin superfamily sugar epimerase